MIVETIVIKCIDSFGNEYGACTGEWGNTIQICGMKNQDGKDVYFESDAYHLIDWCYEHGIVMVDKLIKTDI